MISVVAPVDAEEVVIAGAVTFTTDAHEAVIMARRYAKTSGRDYRVFKLVETHYLKAKP